MESRELTNILRQNPWFQSLDPDHFQKMVDIAQEVSWSKGQIIFGEGDPGDCLYLVAEGRVALEIYVPDRGRRAILTIGPDEVFGWSAVTPFTQAQNRRGTAVFLRQFRGRQDQRTIDPPSAAMCRTIYRQRVDR